MGACISNRIKAVTPHTGSFRFVPFCFRCVFFLIVFQCLIELNLT